MDQRNGYALQNTSNAYSTAQAAQAFEGKTQAQACIPKERTAAQVALQELENHLGNLRATLERFEEVADHLGCSNRTRAEKNAADPIRPVRVGIIGSLHTVTEDCGSVLDQIVHTLGRIEGQV